MLLHGMKDTDRLPRINNQVVQQMHETNDWPPRTVVTRPDFRPGASTWSSTQTVIPAITARWNDSNEATVQ